jgi:hypothetical protein
MIQVINRLSKNLPEAFFKIKVTPENLQVNQDVKCSIHMFWAIFFIKVTPSKNRKERESLFDFVLDCTY